MSMATDHIGFDAHSFLPSRREVAGWLTAGLVAIGAHALAAGVYQKLRDLDEPAAEMEAAMVVDLAPVPFVALGEVESEVIPEQVATQESVALDGASTIAEDVESATLRQETAETLEEVLLERTEPAGEKAVAEDASSQAAVEPAEETEISEPETLETVTPEVAVPLPTPRPEVEPEQPRKRVAGKPKAEPVKKAPKARPAEKVAEKPKETLKSQEAAPAPRSQVSTAQRTSLEERWKSRVLAWINRHKPRNVPGSGIVQVNFQIDSSGSVLGANVIRSSGNDALDQAAIKMVMRSSPVPAPPPEIANSRRSMSLPVQFKR